MVAETRMEAAKGAVLGLLLDAYQRRDRVALVTFRGDDAEVVLRPTGSVEVARARLTELPTGGPAPPAPGAPTPPPPGPPPAGGEGPRPRLPELPTGGRTPLAAGITTALGLAQHPGDRPLLVLVSDG